MSQKSIIKRIIKSTTDIIQEPLNYIYLFSTFMCFYFIIMYNLSLSLIKEFNKLLGFFKIKNSGSSYVSRPREILAAFYNILKEDKVKIYKLSNWYSIQFDESTTRSDPTSTLSLSIA